ncbi:DsbA family protein [Wenxinia saemankumensis]|uniref:Protein-disulfide isomerase n=1 Tax=Wenxinia saemankumensis TaxID=1447782 RepID=A0A1M6GPW6_9RHOB|nr:DsbA family protein [Wenxinia saemankumensis]SHJ11946.1 Protein-disulfide isomerase [Wenxinia saemankumensis]
MFALRRLAPAALALAAATPALALDIESMTDEERQIFRDEVRSYLLDNPEVIMEAIGVLDMREQEAQAQADRDLLAALGPELDDPAVSWVGGNPDGDVTLIEFMDYRCGYCRRAFEEVEQLVNEDGNIRFVVKEFPILGEQSTLASQFAVAVRQLHGDDAYKEVHDLLMTMEIDVSEATLTRLAEQLDLDPAPILDAMGSPEVAEVLAASFELAQQLGINGTPTFVLGGDTMVRGYVPLDSMEAMVARARTDEG